jgi:GT2 family glycosyltransferase
MADEVTLRNDLVSVIILYYKDKDNISNCIQSVLNQTHSSTELLVVDNKSADGVVEILRKNYPQVKFIVLDENRGYCGGNNEGLKHATGQYVFFLNSDVILEKDYVAKMAAAMRSSGKIGLVSGKILRFDRKTLDSAGLFISSKYGLIDRGFDQIDDGHYDKREDIFGCCGAVLFARMSAAEKILENGELFDESFFAFFEDGDVSFRMHIFGYEVLYEPSAIAYHARGASSTGTNNRRFFTKPQYYQHLLLRNRYLFIIKNFPGKFILNVLHKLIFYECLIFTYILIHPKLWCVYSDVLKLFRVTYKKRKKNLSHSSSIIGVKMHDWILREF